MILGSLGQVGEEDFDGFELGRSRHEFNTVDMAVVYLEEFMHMVSHESCTMVSLSFDIQLL